MMSMPARASETEVRARSSRLASLSISNLDSTTSATIVASSSITFSFSRPFTAFAAVPRRVAFCKASRAAAPNDCGVDAGFTIPQCPCDMYSQRQTSPIRIRSGTSRFSARAACCTMPSSAQAPKCIILLVGKTERITDDTPRE